MIGPDLGRIGEVLAGLRRRGAGWNAYVGRQREAKTLRRVIAARECGPFSMVGAWLWRGNFLVVCKGEHAHYAVTAQKG